MDIQHAYAELGLARPADEATVKAAWRRLASQWHPDRNPSQQAVLRMQRINHAFEQIRAAGFAASSAPAASPAGAPSPRPQGGARQGPPPKAASASGHPHSEPPPRAQDSAGSSGPGKGHAGRGRAQDSGATQAPPTAAAPPRRVQRKLKLSLEEAGLGCLRQLSGRDSADCPDCAGTGHHVLAQACPDCQGSGVQRSAGWFGLFAAPLAGRPCEACDGTGVARQACGRCEGGGQLPPQRWRLTVRIPPGVRQGDVLSVSGPAPRDGRPAIEAELRIQLAPHPLFQLADDGLLHGQVPVDGFSWLAERTVEVPTLDGLAPLPLQREQRVYRLPGRGFPVARRGARGDAVVEIMPVFPERYSADQQILLDQLIATMTPARRRAGPASSGDPRLAEWQRTVAAWQRRRSA
jgi:molecular chaperone DnaJ